MLINIPFTDRASYDKTKSRVLEILGVESEFNTPSWPLPNMKEITAEEFWGWRSSYTFRAEVNLLQMKIADKNPHSTFGNPQWATALLYIVDHSQLEGGGFVVLYEYNARDFSSGGSKEGQQAVRYYQFRNCSHEFTSKNVGNCSTDYTCKKCGYTYNVDSSG